VIQLSRLNGSIIAINPDLVTWIEVTPDTTIEFLNGDRIMVRESLHEVMERVIDFRRSVRSPFHESGAHPPSREVLANAKESASHVERPSHLPGRRSHSP